MTEIATSAKVPVWRPVAAKPKKPEAAPAKTETRRVIRRVGGGWYLLPDGRKIQGKDAAIAAARAAETQVPNRKWVTHSNGQKELVSA